MTKFTKKELTVLSDKNILFKGTSVYTKAKLQEILTKMEVEFAADESRDKLIEGVAAKANELRLNTPDDVEELTADGAVAPDVIDSEKEVASANKKAAESEAPVVNLEKQKKDDAERQQRNAAVISQIVKAAVEKEFSTIRSTVSDLGKKVEKLIADKEHKESHVGSINNLGTIEDLGKK